MAGCDYIGNIKGLGFSTLMSFFDDTYNEEKYIKEYLDKQQKKNKIDKVDLLP